LTDEIVFFAATDTPMTDDELLEAPGRILQLPTVIGAVAPIYNLPGTSGELRFSGPVLADIFLGRITNWNDPAIAKLNAGIALPPTDITPIYRSESSGTSFIRSDFLSKVSPVWRRMVGATRSLRLPVGASAKGSEGVSALVKQTPGAIGYVEWI
jgi:phosphate transport system substrate-binding protein